MLLQELKEQIFKLPSSELTSQRLRYRLAFVSAIIESLQNQPTFDVDRSGAIQRMRDLLKTDQPAPTDEQVAAMLEERRVEKYI
jgi:hypothetical protein